MCLGMPWNNEAIHRGGWRNAKKRQISFTLFRDYSLYMGERHIL